MGIRVGRHAIREIQDLFNSGAMGSWTDGQLVAEFLTGQAASEAAFRVLIHRHGPMVLGICRRILGDAHAAEDAFQATFLALVKKAHRLRDRNLLANWLYGAALRAARKERAKALRRRAVERHAADTRSTWQGEDAERAELRAVIDEEIEKMPERYRVPLILCHVQGLRHDEAARRLGCPVGTIESRLSRARDQLRSRITRRGLAPTTSALGLVLKPPDSSAAVALHAMIEPAIEAAIKLSPRRVGVLAAIVQSFGQGVWSLCPPLQVGVVVSTLVAGVAMVVTGFGVFRADGELPRPWISAEIGLGGLTDAEPDPQSARATDRPPRASGRPGTATIEATGPSRETTEDPRHRAAARLAAELRRHPARPSDLAGQVGLYLIDADGGPATLIANEPAPGLNQCGSPCWSHDGRRIVFDATPGAAVGRAQFQLSHLWSLQLEGDRLSAQDLGEGNCPDFSPADDRIVFLLNSTAEPGAQVGVWLMQADGSGRRSLGTYGRPRWSPESRQFLIAGFSSPTPVTIMDVRPERSGDLDLPDRAIFSFSSWAGEGTIVAVIGPVGGPGDAIALIDVTDLSRAKVKEVLWKQGQGPNVKPYSPIYSPATRRCVFIGKTEGKGRALYALSPGRAAKPARLEAEGRHDNLIQDPTFSPDGRFVIFSGDRRPDHGAGPAAGAR
jgi:RNA polymerase sigma factor (sigma-70 family)